MNVIIIAGMPAAGKSTLAMKISQSLHYPILEKDAIKEEIFDIMGFRDYQDKILQDDMANAILLRCTEALLQSNTSLICVNNFRPEAQERLQNMLDRYACHSVTLFLGGDSDVFYQRYVERDRKHLRHLGHILQENYPPKEGDCLDYTMTRQEFAEKFEAQGMDSFSIDGPRINIDATYPEKIDVKELIIKIKTLL